MGIFQQLGGLRDKVLGRTPNGEKSLTVPTAELLNPSDWKGGKGFMPGSDFWYFGLDGGNDYHFTYSNLKSCIKAYTECSPVNAIVNKKAQAFINGKTYITNLKGKEVKSPLATHLRKLLNKPNPIQSAKQFEAQGYTHVQLFGFNIILCIKPTGFKKNRDAYQLWNLPPCMLDIEETKALFYQTTRGQIINKIVLNYRGERTLINVDDIIIVNDINVSFKSLVFSESRVRALKDPINNIIASYEARRTLMKRRGALGILSNDSTGPMGPAPLLPAEKDRLQAEFMENYGIMPDQFQVIITSASLKWQSMGYPTKDLMLFEEIEDNIMRVCDGFNYPYRLLANQRTNALGGSDIKDFKAVVYEDAIIPEAESYYEQITNGFALEEEENVKIIKDYSHIPVLQRDKVQEANARKLLNEAMKLEFDNGLITLDEWRAALDEDPLPEGKGNFRATDPKESNVPLAVTIGVGGVQSLISIVTAQGMSGPAKQSTLEILFGITAQDAARMTVAEAQPPAEGGPNGNNPGTSGNGNNNQENEEDEETEEAA